MLVEEVMTRDVVKIDCNSTVMDACKVYSKNKVGCLVVMDKNITVGIVTERDTIERVILQNKDPNKTLIREIMSPNIITVHALAPLDKAAQTMKDSNIKKLPVILNNEIVGIITETDMSRTINAFSEAVDELIEFYSESKDNIEKMMDDWGNLLINIKSFKKLNHNKEHQVIEKEV
jgi:CBS domain-containing protein